MTTVFLYFQFVLFIYLIVFPFLFIALGMYAVVVAFRYKLTLKESCVVVLLTIVLSCIILILSHVYLGDTISQWHMAAFICAGPLPLGTLLFTIVTTFMKLPNRWLKLARVTFQLSMGVTILIGFSVGEVLPKLLGVTIIY